MMAEQKFIQYGDRVMEMEDGMTLEQAKAIMARHFPELAEPAIETKESGGKTTYVFSKKAGRKGRAANARTMARRLVALPQAVLAPEWAIAAAETLDVGVDARQAQETLDALTSEAVRTREAVSALLSLPSQASRESVLL